MIGEEDLLEAIAATPRGAALLAPLTAAVVRREIRPAVARARSAGGLSAADREALAAVGVDVEALVARIDPGGPSGPARATLGPARPGGGWGQRMTDSAAVALARAEDLAVAEGRRAVGLDHLLVGLVETPSLVTEHLLAHGVTPATVAARRASAS